MESREPAAPGELLIQGPNVFMEYWRRPDATADAFTADGFFRSGDTASVEELPGPAGSPAPYWRILGRTSVDILKSGGKTPLYHVRRLDSSCAASFILKYTLHGGWKQSKESCARPY